MWNNGKANVWPHQEAKTYMHNAAKSCNHGESKDLFNQLDIQEDRQDLGTHIEHSLSDFE